ncbi:host attachment family protein [Agrobacterium tumefaciens]|jgi:protein required for attachment to host cells|uniref:host attachment family protein n=1 Tax=Agrobacterium tumefaciens TaxID=358 RepID=UPI00157229F8|nr:host attachment family protein [Agrobacterium tumefaciens]WCK68725.1 host attachment family protein [Agrobacterium tumefaciens]
MDRKIIPYNARILVADGKKALLLRNAGNAAGLLLEVEQVLEAPDNAANHEQGTDRPGRTATGSNRSSLDQTDFHELEEDRFLATVAERIEQHWLNAAVRSVYIIAPPRALARLRKSISPALKTRIVSEHDKDLVNLPIAEIERCLSS